jgi:hypothetical protein
MATKICKKVPKISGSSLWNWIRVALLAPRIMKWFQEFCENLPTPGYEVARYYGLTEVLQSIHIFWNVTL